MFRGETENRVDRAAPALQSRQRHETPIAELGPEAWCVRLPRRQREPPIPRPAPAGRPAAAVPAPEDRVTEAAHFVAEWDVTGLTTHGARASNQGNRRRSLQSKSRREADVDGDNGNRDGGALVKRVVTAVRSVVHRAAPLADHKRADPH